MALVMHLSSNKLNYRLVMADFIHVNICFNVRTTNANCKQKEIKQGLGVLKGRQLRNM